jgi:PAS domain S-box-containing protein
MNPPEPTERRAEWGLVLIFALLSLGIVVGGAFYYRHYERQFRAAAEHQLAAITELKVNELAQYRKERLEDAAIFFHNAAFSGLVRRFFDHPEDAGAQRQIQEWTVKLVATGQYDLVRLLDAQGVNHLSMPAGAPPVSSVVSQRIPEILRLGQVTFQDFHRNEHDQRVYLDILIPLFDEPNASRPLGVFYLRIDPDKYLYPFIQRWPVPSQTAETLLVRRESNDVLFLNELKFRTNAALNLRISLTSNNMPAVKAVLGQQGIVDGTDYRGAPVLAALRAVPDSPWFLVARIDTTEVFAPMRARLWQVVVMICVLIFGSAACVGLVWRQQQSRFLEAQYKSAAALLRDEARFHSLASILQHPATNVQEFLDFALNEAITLTGSKIGYIYFYHADRKEFVLNTWSKDVMKECKIQNPQTCYELDKTGIWGEAVRQRKPIILNDFQAEHPLKKGYPEGHARLDKYLTVPVFSGGEIVAVVAVANKAVDYDEADVTQLQLLMDAVWTMLERRQAEEKLRQLSTAVEQSPASIVITNPAGNIEYVNPKFVQVTGYTSAEALGKNPRILKSGEKSPEAYRELWETISAGKEWNGEFHNKTKNGELYWEIASISPIRDPAGRVTHYVAVKEDITARKQTEAERDKLIQDLQEALANIKSLSGLLPICASCKKIRDDQGYWSQVESYIQKHSDATFTHGICPDCIKKLYPDLAEGVLGNRTEKAP